MTHETSVDELLRLLQIEKGMRLAAEEKSEEEKAMRLAAEEKARRTEFIENLQSIWDLDKLIQEIDLADFKPSELQEQAGSGTGPFINCNDSKATSVSGGTIYMSKFHRKQVHGTDDAMKVTLLDIPMDRLLEPLRKICSDVHIEADAFIRDEIDIVNKIRGALEWLMVHNPNAMSESIVQKMFVLYTDGLLKKLRLVDFKVHNINGITLQASILMKKCDGQVALTLSGKSDVSISFDSSSSEADDSISSNLSVSEKSILHPKSVTVEMKYQSLDGSDSKVGSCTSQQLAQIFAISKMRNISDGPIVRSILTNFFKIRLAVGIPEGAVISYMISTLSSDPLYLIGGIVLMLSESLEDILKHPSDLLQEISDEEDDMNEQDLDDDELDVNSTENHLHVKSLNEAFTKLSSSEGGGYETFDNLSSSRAGGDRGTSRGPLKQLDTNILCMGDDDDDPVIELNKRRQLLLKKWEAARLGTEYLCAEALQSL